MTARSIELARAAVSVAKLFDVAFMGLAGTCHQTACEESGVKFIAEWFADLDYSSEGKLLITKCVRSHLLRASLRVPLKAFRGFTRAQEARPGAAERGPR